MTIVALAVSGCGSGQGSQARGKGDRTSKDAVVDVLERSGYRISYRQVANVPGYQTVAGRARSKRGGVVDFAVVVSERGRYEGGIWGGADGSPQPPVVRYMEMQPTMVGNILYAIEPQSPYVRGHLRNFGPAYVGDRGEDEMVVELAAAIERLFGPGVVGDG